MEERKMIHDTPNLKKITRENPALMKMANMAMAGLAIKAGVPGICVDPSIIPSRNKPESILYDQEWLQTPGNGHAILLDPLSVNASAEYGLPGILTPLLGIGAAMQKMADASGLRLRVDLDPITGRGGRLGLIGQDSDMVERSLRQLGRKLDELDLPQEYLDKAKAAFQESQRNHGADRGRS